jgi:hypothetical protein
MSRDETFTIKGQPLAYNRMPHANVPQSERSVELPIVIQFLSALPRIGRMLEVGNVLSYYGELLPPELDIASRRTIDKFERASGVENIDLMDVDTGDKFDTIVSISTLEHVGQAVDPRDSYGETGEERDPDAPLEAVARIYGMLNIGGRAVITVPFGKFTDHRWFIQFGRDYLDRLYDELGVPRLAVETYAMKLVGVTDDNNGDPEVRVWREGNPDEMDDIEYNAPLPFANGILVIEMTRIADDDPLLIAPPGEPVDAMSARLCVQRDFEMPYHRFWTAKLKLPSTYHRKFWDWAAIAQALWERGLLKPDTKGLGFAVGTEPLVSAFASFGCSIVATDQSVETPEAQRDWGATDQLCSGRAALNRRRICPEEQFQRLVSYRTVDMRHIPDDLKQGEFDFIWSSCSFEHIGSIEHGLTFVREAMRCLNPGGYAVHTTEFNCYSDDATIEAHNLVFFRRRDIGRLVAELESAGHTVEPIDYSLGDSPCDSAPLREPHDHTAPHTKVQLADHVATSLLLIMRNNLAGE